MDTLSDVLAILRPQTFVSAGLDAGKEWAIQFPPHDGIKFNAILKGTCYLQVEGDENVYLLHAGDCFLLTSGRRFVMGSDLSIPTIHSDTIFSHAKDGIATCNGGGSCFLTGARFHFGDQSARLLFGQLPPVVYVPEKYDQAAVLRWGIERFTTEFRSERFGRRTILEHLAPIMLVQTLRIYMSSPGAKNTGWFAAVVHPNLGAVMQAIHSRPQEKWTVESLSEQAYMSRSGFALKFRQVIGQSPLEYLTQWRMFMAAEYLKSTDQSISEIALAVGYESESSFSAAFKKVMGAAPRSYKGSAVK